MHHHRASVDSSASAEPRIGRVRAGGSACSELVDEFTREALAIRVARKLTSWDVTDTPVDLFIEREAPVHIRSDQRPDRTLDSYGMDRGRRDEDGPHREGGPV